MIIGIGSDLIDITRIERTLERFGDRFVQRCFTQIEQNKSDRRAKRADSYAKRYAAKEACSKALGTGFRRGVFWRDMGVVNLPSGKPTLALTGGGGKAPGRDYATGNETADRLVAHRRAPHCPGHCHHYRRTRYRRRTIRTLSQITNFPFVTGAFRCGWLESPLRRYYVETR